MSASAVPPAALPGAGAGAAASPARATSPARLHTPRASSCATTPASSAHSPERRLHSRSGRPLPPQPPPPPNLSTRLYQPPPPVPPVTSRLLPRPFGYLAAPTPPPAPAPAIASASTTALLSLSDDSSAAYTSNVHARSDAYVEARRALEQAKMDSRRSARSRARALGAATAAGAGADSDGGNSSDLGVDHRPPDHAFDEYEEGDELRPGTVASRQGGRGSPIARREHPYKPRVYLTPASGAAAAAAARTTSDEKESESSPRPLDPFGLLHNFQMQFGSVPPRAPSFTSDSAGSHSALHPHPHQRPKRQPSLDFASVALGSLPSSAVAAGISPLSAFIALRAAVPGVNLTLSAGAASAPLAAAQAPQQPPLSSGPASSSTALEGSASPTSSTPALASAGALGASLDALSGAAAPAPAAPLSLASSGSASALGASAGSGAGFALPVVTPGSAPFQLKNASGAAASASSSAAAASASASTSSSHVLGAVAGLNQAPARRLSRLEERRREREFEREKRELAAFLLGRDEDASTPAAAAPASAAPGPGAASSAPAPAPGTAAPPSGGAGPRGLRSIVEEPATAPTPAAARAVSPRNKKRTLSFAPPGTGGSRRHSPPRSRPASSAEGPGPGQLPPPKPSMRSILTGSSDVALAALAAAARSSAASPPRAAGGGKSKSARAAAARSGSGVGLGLGLGLGSPPRPGTGTGTGVGVRTLSLESKRALEKERRARLLFDQVTGGMLNLHGEAGALPSASASSVLTQPHRFGFGLDLSVEELSRNVKQEQRLISGLAGDGGGGGGGGAGGSSADDYLSSSLAAQQHRHHRRMSSLLKSHPSVRSSASQTQLLHPHQHDGAGAGAAAAGGSVALGTVDESSVTSASSTHPAAGEDEKKRAAAAASRAEAAAASGEYTPLSPELCAALIKATKRGDATMISALIAQCPSEQRLDFINMRDKNGSTAIFHTTWPGHFFALRMLLEHGADPNIQNVKQNTALHLAVERGHQSLIRCLLSHGADATLRNFEDKLCYQTPAAQEDRVEMERFIANTAAEVKRGTVSTYKLDMAPVPAGANPFDLEFYRQRRGEHVLARAQAAAAAAADGAVVEGELLKQVLLAEGPHSKRSSASATHAGTATPAATARPSSSSSAMPAAASPPASQLHVAPWFASFARRALRNAAKPGAVARQLDEERARRAWERGQRRARRKARREARRANGAQSDAEERSHSHVRSATAPSTAATTTASAGAGAGPAEAFPPRNGGAVDGAGVADASHSDDDSDDDDMNAGPEEFESLLPAKDASRPLSGTGSRPVAQVAAGAGGDGLHELERPLGHAILSIGPQGATFSAPLSARMDACTAGTSPRSHMKLAPPWQFSDDLGAASRHAVALAPTRPIVERSRMDDPADPRATATSRVEAGLPPRGVVPSVFPRGFPFHSSDKVRPVVSLLTAPSLVARAEEMGLLHPPPGGALPGSPRRDQLPGAAAARGSSRARSGSRSRARRSGSSDARAPAAATAAATAAAAADPALMRRAADLLASAHTGAEICARDAPEQFGDSDEDADEGDLLGDRRPRHDPDGQEEKHQPPQPTQQPQQPPPQQQAASAREGSVRWHAERYAELPVHVHVSQSRPGTQQSPALTSRPSAQATVFSASTGQPQHHGSHSARTSTAPLHATRRAAGPGPLQHRRSSYGASDDPEREASEGPPLFSSFPAPAGGAAAAASPATPHTAKRPPRPSVPPGSAFGGAVVSAALQAPIPPSATVIHEGRDYQFARQLQQQAHTRMDGHGIGNGNGFGGSGSVTGSWTTVQSHAVTQQLHMRSVTSSSGGPASSSMSTGVARPHTQGASLRPLPPHHQQQLQATPRSARRSEGSELISRRFLVSRESIHAALKEIDARNRASSTVHTTQHAKRPSAAGATSARSHTPLQAHYSARSRTPALHPSIDDSLYLHPSAMTPIGF